MFMGQRLPRVCIAGNSGEGLAVGPLGSCLCGKGCGSGAPSAGSAERPSAGPAQ